MFGRVLLALWAGANAVVLRKDEKKDCRVKCQRFQWKLLGDEFKSITSPQSCMSKCDEVYSTGAASLLEVSSKPHGHNKAGNEHVHLAHERAHPEHGGHKGATQPPIKR